MKRIFKVDQDGIDNGIQDTIGFCPVALSIKKMYKGVMVSTTSITFGFGPTEIEFENTEELEQWIRDFDDSKKVEPMEVCLDFDQSIASLQEVSNV